MSNNDDATRDDYNYITAHSGSIKIIENCQVMIALISTICSFSVCFILIYKRHVLLKNRPFVHIILMIAITDTLTSMVYSFGFPKSDNLCFFQGFFGVFFSRASWLYTTALVIQLTSIVIGRRFFISNKRLIIAVATLNIILQLLPFTTNTTYGGYLGTEVCFLDKGRGTYEQLRFWEEFCYFSVQIICFSIIFLLSVILVAKSYTPGLVPMLYQQIEDAWHTVILYPIGMAVAW